MKPKKFSVYYFITLLFLLLASSSNFISSDNLLWFLVTLFMILVGIKRKLFTPKDIKKIVVFSGLYLLFVGIRDIFINGSDLSLVSNDVAYLFKYILLTFIYCSIMKEKLITNLVKVSTHLAIISIFFYVLQLIGFKDFLFNIPSLLNLPGVTASGGQNSDSANFVIFGISKVHLFRNSGFFWEPGAFACFLVMILMLNLFLNKFVFERDSKILTIAILTTASTTGYLAVLLILFLLYRYKVPKLNVWVIVLLPILVVLFMTIPVLSDKITKTYQEDLQDMTFHNLKKSAKDAFYHKDKNAAIPLNRFASMSYLNYLFGPQLILGANSNYSTFMNALFRVDISNGIYDFFARFGVVGFLLLLYKYGKFSSEYLLTKELMTYSILLFLVVCFGEPIVHLPFMLIFLFISLPQLKPVDPAVANFRRFNPPVFNDTTKRI